jgi:hypothetical protein
MTRAVEFLLLNNSVLVRIVKQPQGTAEDFALRGYRVGQCYDLPATVAFYLIVNDYAVAELRKQPRTKDRPTPKR